MALRSALLVLGGGVVAAIIDGVLEKNFKGTRTGIYAIGPTGVTLDDFIPAVFGVIMLILSLFDKLPMKGTLTLFFAGWVAYYLGTTVGSMVAGVPSLGTGNAFFGLKM